MNKEIAAKPNPLISKGDGLTQVFNSLKDRHYEDPIVVSFPLKDLETLDPMSLAGNL